MTLNQEVRWKGYKNIEKLGMGLGTRLRSRTAQLWYNFPHIATTARQLYCGWWLITTVYIMLYRPQAVSLIFTLTIDLSIGMFCYSWHATWGHGSKYIIIGGEMHGSGGRGGSRPPPPPPHSEDEGEGWAPSFFKCVYIQYALHNKKKPQNYCQKDSETVSQSWKFKPFLGEHAPRSP